MYMVDPFRSTTARTCYEHVAAAMTQRDIYKTISLIKAKDPRIYEKDVKFFQGMHHLHARGIL